MLEELEEVAQCAGFFLNDGNFLKKHKMDMEKDLAGALDGLVDLLYVLMGTVILMGFHRSRYIPPTRGCEVYGACPSRFEEAWDRVQAANMKKVLVERPDQSKRGHKYDCQKPFNWHPPVLDDLI